MRRAAGFAISTCPSASMTSTGSGNESMVAWLVCWAQQELGELRLAIIAQVAGHDVEGLGQLPQLIAERPRSRPDRGCRR